jgi:hypothetical protein
LVYDDVAGTVVATGPMLAEYLKREVELMVVGVVQKNDRGDVTGAAFAEGNPGNGTLTVVKQDDGNGIWTITLKENDEPVIGTDNATSKPFKTLTPKKLKRTKDLSVGIAFVKLRNGDADGGQPGEWYGWLSDGLTLVAVGTNLPVPADTPATA